MTAFDDAKVWLAVADYAAIDPAGKVTLVGAGFTITGLTPEGQTPPQHLVILVQMPQSRVGETYTLGVELRSVESGGVVSVPTPPSGEHQALRVQQLVRVDPPNLPPGVQGSPHIPCGTNLVLNFPVGLPLAVGSYFWRVEVDGQHRKSWRAPFTVVGPNVGPIFGGPVGPSAVPGVQQPLADQPDEPPEPPDDPAT